MKYLVLLAVAALAWRMVTGHWPWSFLKSLSGEPGASGPRSAEAEGARVLLGVGKQASREDIIEAHKKLVAMVHPDRGGTSDQVHEANRARDVLLAQAAGRSKENA